MSPRAGKKPKQQRPAPQSKDGAAGPGHALVIVAHPDDAEFLCGGTVARWCSEGWTVDYVLTTSGDMGSKEEGMTRKKLVTWDPFRRGFNHRDHRLTGQAALDAVYPLARNPLGYPEHLQEGLEVHRVNEVLLAGTDQPDYFVDVSKFLGKKIDALREHKSQIGQAPPKELQKRLRARMAEVGKEPGYKLAEAFRRISWG